jgi:UDP-glucose 4-epimerase
MKKILVTGGCGFIGYRLTQRLISEGFNVDVIDNLSIGPEAKDVTNIGARFLGGDVRAMENIQDTNYQYIFHLAALSRIQPSFKKPNSYFSVNIDGTRQVIEYSLRNNSKLIYAGSSSKHHNPELSPYAMSKHIGEELIKLYKMVYGLNSEIVRFYNVYGEGELVNSEMAAVIGIWRSCILNNEPLKIVGDGEQRRDFTHVDDIVDGLMKVSFSEESHDDGWELGTGKNYSINEVYEMFHKKFGCKKVNVPNQLGNYEKTLRINDDALKRLGWQPIKDLKEYILNLN